MINLKLISRLLWCYPNKQEVIVLAVNSRWIGFSIASRMLWCYPDEQEVMNDVSSEQKADVMLACSAG
jgi:hypothetical protein